MTKHEVAHVRDVDSFSDVETVHVTVIQNDKGAVGFAFDREVDLKKGDAIENPPLSVRVGDEFDLRIIRGYETVTAARAVWAA